MEKDFRYQTVSSQDTEDYACKCEAFWAKWTKFQVMGIFLTLCILLSSLALNALLLINKVDYYPNSHYGLASDTIMVFQQETDYSSDNHTLADSLWENIDTNSTMVALNNEFARAKGLMSENRFPWDDEKSVFPVRGFHNIHCLKSLRRALIDYQRGNDKIIHDNHVHHCLDLLRQDIMCNADNTPLNPRSNQNMQCRDWNKLLAWAKEPVRNACYSRIEEYKGVEHELDRYMYCPENSPYYQVAKEYQEIHGYSSLEA